MGLPGKFALFAAALWVGWLLVDRLAGPTQVDAPAAPAQVSPIASAASAASAAAAAGPASQAATVPAAGAAPSAASQVRAAAPAPSAAVPRAQAAAQLNEEANLGLTTRLSGDQGITLDQRQRSILGARVVSGDEGLQTLVVTRDEASGQIEYWQAALRFALRPGVDAEAFIRARPTLNRQFVNADYADVAVAPGELAAAFKALAADPAVTGVRLLPLRPKVVVR